ncbi:MAG: hypothetical protein D6706_10625 [Chloroflexi bacterium]|nr:MAG: hypothetical protein D6706_10625 [Chloroflexota bacterium]
MADNVAITEGSGKVVLADELTDGVLGTGVVQFVKLMDGTLDSSTKLKIAAEDSAHASGDGGIMLLAVRKDTATALANADGDYIPLIVDDSGRLYVNINAPLPAGTNNIGDVDVASLPSLPAGTNNIGDVDVVSLPALPAGTNNIGDVDIASMPADTFVAEAGALGKGVLIQGDDGTDRQNVQVDADGAVKTHSSWAPALQADETLGDSDKTLTVTAGKEWHIMSIHVELSTSATVGTRQLEIQVRDTADDVIASYRVRLTQAESTSYHYEFAPGVANDTSIVDSNHATVAIPPTLILPAGYDVRIFDNNAVDAAADNMIVQMLVMERTA